SEWSQEYEPIQLIKIEWYNKLLDPITVTELDTTIREASTNKMTGLQNISNEILKHLTINTKEASLKNSQYLLRIKDDTQIIAKEQNILNIEKQNFSRQLKIQDP
ncbi:6576_t:CDS:1, partial [Gigaspora margarita]